MSSSLSPNAAAAWTTILREQFFCRTDLIAVLAPWGKPTPAEIKSDTELLALIRSHLCGTEVVARIRRPDGTTSGAHGKWRVGSYTPRPGTSVTSWFAIDIDGGLHKSGVKDPRGVLRRVLARAQQLDIPVHAEVSGGGVGLHVWGFFDEPIPAARARQLALALCPSDAELVAPTPRTGETLADPVRNRGIEVFPKQATLPAGATGNMVWLPMWSGAVPPANRFTDIADDDAPPTSPFATIPAAKVEAALARAGGWKRDDATRAKIQAESVWRDWRRDALAKLNIHGVYSDVLTGKSQGQGWLEARDPWSPSGDQNPSAGVATGDGDQERGAWHSFISGETFSVFDYLVRRGVVGSFTDAVAWVATQTNVRLPVLERSAEGSLELRAAAGPERPQILLNDAELHSLLGQAWAALLRWNDPPRLFRRGQSVVALQQENDGFVTPVVVRAETLRPRLSKAAQWIRSTPKGNVVEWPPDSVVKAMCSEPHPKLPPLDIVIRAPFFAPDGTLVSSPGYHPAAHAWFDAAGALDVGDIPEEPSSSDLEAALDLLVNQLLQEFPFVAEADRAHALALLILPFVRQMIRGQTPLHVIEAPAPGSGKTALAELNHILATGYSLVPLSLPAEDEELRKLLHAELLTSPAAICFDNLPDRRLITAQPLVTVLTSEFINSRTLGFSSMAKAFNRTTWIATGNNPRFSAELARRCVRIRLDAGMQRPEARTFSRRFPEWALERRAALVRAILIVVRSWMASGSQDGEGDMPSFGVWSKLIGGVLHHVGVPGFLGNLAEFRECAEPETDDFSAFVEGWWETFGSGKVTAAALVTTCHAKGLLPTIVAGDARRDVQGMGMALARHRDQVFGAWKVTRAGLTGGRVQWSLTPVRSRQ